MVLQDMLRFFSSSVNKTRNQLIRLKASQPEKYKKISQMKRVDFSQTLTFPIKVPLREKYVYSPVKSVQKVKSHDFLSFDNKSGNEILLYLDQAANLRSAELTNALVELSKKPIQAKIDWNAHEYVQKALGEVKGKLPQFKSHHVSMLCLALKRLEIQDPQVWQMLEVECKKQKHNFTSFGYAQMVQSMAQNEYISQEFKEEMKADLPMKLWKMAPDQITDCFSLLVEQGMKQGDFVFENHFMVLFWRRNAWFGAKNYPKILRSLHTLKYDEHEEFWVDFLPKIKEMVPNLDEPITYDLLEVLQDIQSDVNVEDEVKFLKQHLVFCQTKLRAIENNKFYNVILNDLAYFKEKQQLSLEKNL